MKYLGTTVYYLPIQETTVKKQKLLLYSFVTTSFDFSFLIATPTKGLLLQLALNEAITIINMDLISENKGKLPMSTEHDISENVISRHI